MKLSKKVDIVVSHDEKAYPSNVQTILETGPYRRSTEIDLIGTNLSPNEVG